MTETQFCAIEDLNLNTDAIQAFITAKADAEAECAAANAGLREARAKVAEIKAAASRGEKVSAQTLANAHAGVELEKVRSRGADHRLALVQREATVTDLDLIQGMAPELSSIFGGKVPILYGLGAAPETIPDGYSTPLIVVTQDKDATHRVGWARGTVTLTYFREEMHTPMTKDILSKQIGDSARLVFRRCHTFDGGDIAVLDCEVSPAVPLTTGPLTKGQSLSASSLQGAFFKAYGARYGMTSDGIVLDGVSRVQPMRPNHFLWDRIGTGCVITSVSTEGTTQTTTATITAGWIVRRPTQDEQRYGNPLRADEFPGIVESGKDKMVGSLDSSLGRIIEVPSMTVSKIGNGVYKVVMVITSVGRIH